MSSYEWIAASRIVQSLLYILDGPRTIQTGYEQSRGKPFVIHTPINDHILVSSSEHIQELINAPSSELSLHAVAKEILQPKYTMHGFEWRDQRGVEGTGFVRALRSILTAQLPALMPSLDNSIKKELKTEIERCKKVKDTYHIAIAPSIKRVVAKANCLVFFGEELSQNVDFVEAALRFPQDVIIAAEFVRLVPNCLAKFAASFASGGHRSSNEMLKFLTPIVAKRMEKRQSSPEYYGEKQNDCMQWLIDTSPRSNPWSVERMIGEIMAIWFSSVHQLAMTATFAVLDLCRHPQYASTLRQEVEKTPITANGLPLLDSFLKESMRYNSIDAITCRRKALVPFQLSGGFTVSPGDWLCIPQQAMMLDPQKYNDPSSFDPFRFTNHKDSTQEVRVRNPETGLSTEPSPDWLVWGSGKTVCPGRFYAAAIVKLIMSQILQDYDCSLPDLERPWSRSWRTSIVPRESFIILLRKRRLGREPAERDPNIGFVV